LGCCDVRKKKRKKRKKFKTSHIYLIFFINTGSFFNYALLPAPQKKKEKNAKVREILFPAD